VLEQPKIRIRGTRARSSLVLAQTSRDGYRAREGDQEIDPDTDSDPDADWDTTFDRNERRDRVAPPRGRDRLGFCV